MGTRFMATQEAPFTRMSRRPSWRHRARYAAGHACMRNTERVLKNQLSTIVGIEKEKGEGPRSRTSRSGRGDLPARHDQGDMDAGAWSCGMVAGLIYDIPTVQELIDRIMAEAEKLVRIRLERMLAA